MRREIHRILTLVKGPLDEGNDSDILSIRLTNSCGSAVIVRGVQSFDRPVANEVNYELRIAN